jgi:hypothetical protein
MSTISLRNEYVTMRTRVAVLCSVIVAGLGAAALPASADPIGLTGFGGSVTGRDGAPDRQAGAHSEVETHFTVKSHIDPQHGLVPDANVKDVIVDLPEGLVGNPLSATKCSNDKLAAIPDGDCPSDAQVGVAKVHYIFGGGATEQQTDVVGLFNVTPPPGVVARFGFTLLSTTVVLDAKLTATGGYHVAVVSRNTSQGFPVLGFEVTLWGVPADARHDPERGGPSQLVPRPFVSTPTACPPEPHETTIALNSWQDPGAFAHGAFSSNSFGPLRTENCEGLPFEPGIELKPTTTAPDAPTGLDVSLRVPQDNSPDGLATAHLKDAEVTLPDGVSINPGSADGLSACSDVQLGLGGDEPATCPAASKVGTVTVRTPVLDEVLTGGVYVRSQASDDPQSGEMFRVALDVVNEERGVRVKLGGRLFVDSGTGRIRAVFEDNPQVPVSSIELAFKSGPRAPLAAPASCGSASYQARLVAWSGRVAGRSSAFDVDCSSALGAFSPGFSAGVETPTAGGFSPFALALSKPDGNTPLTGLSMDLPRGLVAQLKGNLGAQVGTVKVFAGPGTNPFVLPGGVFLEGAYGDAPFSLKAVVPAKAGPFDLGEVVVRQKVYVDPIDAHVTVVSDPLPTIVKGVPARLQRVEVNVDKAGFMINPTSCDPTEIKGTLSSAIGQSVPVTNRFQVGDCSALVLKPNLGLTLSGKGQTTDGKHPAIAATVSQPAGQANLKKVRVMLPLSLALDQDNANGLCEFVDGSKVTPTCPKSSIVGTATATTPILNEPLSGPVYFVKNQRTVAKTGRQRATLPKLVIPLVGENGLKLTLTGTSDVEDDHLVTTFDNIPDAPVSSFKLNINGGKGGILAVSGADICKSTQVAEQQVDGQNNKAADADVFIQTPSCPLKVLSKKVGKRSVAIKVGGLHAGKLTVTGKGIKKSTKKISKSTVATITVKRTKGHLGKVKVSFTAAGSKKAKSVTTALSR